MKVEVSEEAVLALTKAKVLLMSSPDSVFFTTLCFSMKHEWSTSIPTACCDGKRVLWNPDFFMGLAGADERVFLMLHETMHAAYLHVDPVRRAGRDPRKWNVAADHVINLQLIERGFKMPTGRNKGLADPQYKGMSTEEVYKLLPEEVEMPNMEDLVEGEGQDVNEIREHVQDALVRASIQSKMAGDKPGTIPGDIEVFLEKLLDPILPWDRILRKFFNSFAKNDYTFKRPNRRYFPKYHLPSLYSTSLMDISIAVDISGSVSDEDFLRFVSEIASILKKHKPKNITIIQFDTEIKSVDTVGDMAELMKIRFTGRGGTAISPVIEWANENKPQLLLFFTDGEFRFYGNDTKVNTVWLIHNNEGFLAPFGKVIHYNI